MKRENRVKKMSEGKKPDDFLTTRRNLLKGLLTFMGTLGLGGIFYGILDFLARGEGAHAPIEISLSQIPTGTTFLFQYGGSPRILIHEENGEMEAYSLVCTHLGCIVFWRPEKKEFHCPCHDGLFDAHGKVVSGPPTSPLEGLKVKVIGEKVVIG
jgi:cytochrome b6-f complex iron-sulfur subunit